VDATDESGATISLGFSTPKGTMRVDKPSRDRITRGLKRRPETIVLGDGFGTIDGRPCIWHKYTGPVARPQGRRRMTVVHYLLPLPSGRALEVRLAALPEKFGELGPQMKQSFGTLRLLTPQASAK
jgi:hypothetical protein